MKAWLLRYSDQLRSSYWFLPTIMTVAAFFLAELAIWLDVHEGSTWMTRISWLYVSRPSGARQVLSSIGGSMITVAGTTFSVTIAAVVYASGQYGPRLLTNFMSDRGNQVTLGTFIATFLYCLLVLRTVRDANESGGVAFVPNIALLGAVLLAMCSIAVLIFFIHHVPSKIHINSVIEDVGDRLLAELDHRYPRFIGQPKPTDDTPEDDLLPAAFRRDATREQAANRMLVNARATGYIVVVDDDAIMKAARRHDLVLRLQYQPGDFLHVGRTLVEAWPPERCTEDAMRAIGEAYAVGSRRSALQDLRFLIDELVEIAARALSPGVNDPFTAVTCLDWLSATMSDLAGRELPSHLRLGERGELRVITHAVSFEGLLDRAFGALAQYAAADMVAGLRFIRALGEVSLDCDDPARLVVIGETADRFGVLAAEKLSGFNRERVATRLRELHAALAEPDYKRRLRDGTAWLGGTA